MMDDIAEQTDIANEISNAISQPVGFGDPVDDVGISCNSQICIFLRAIGFHEHCQDFERGVIFP
jgi:hypothetical protein